MLIGGYTLEDMNAFLFAHAKAASSPRIDAAAATRLLEIHLAGILAPAPGGGGGRRSDPVGVLGSGALRDDPPVAVRDHVWPVLRLPVPDEHTDRHVGGVHPPLGGRAV